MVIHVHNPPLGPDETPPFKQHVGLCGRKFYGVGYADAEHLTGTVASYGERVGGSWGNWCLNCKRIVDNACHVD